MKEKWKFIDWIEGIPVWKYKISNMGRLFSTCERGGFISIRNNHGTALATITNKPDDMAGKTLVKTSLAIAKAVATAFVPPPKGYTIQDCHNTLSVKHLDGDCMNNRADNLTWSVNTCNPNSIISPADMGKIIRIIAMHPTETVQKLKLIIRESLGDDIIIADSTICRLRYHKDDLDGYFNDIFEREGFTENRVRDEQLYEQFSNAQIHFICQKLIENGGSPLLTARACILDDRFQNKAGFDEEDLAHLASHIKTKHVWRDISDKYFDENFTQTAFPDRVGIKVDVYTMGGAFIGTVNSIEKARKFKGMNINAETFWNNQLLDQKPTHGYLFIEHDRPIQEIWKPIDWLKHVKPGYYVSNKGRVVIYSIKGTCLISTKSRYYKLDGMDVEIVNLLGEYNITATRRQCVRAKVKELVAHAFMPEYKQGMKLDHLDGNTENCDVSNLLIIK